MDFKEMELDIPANLTDLLEQIQKIDAKVCIAGSFLLKKHMKKETNEVSFYVSHYVSESVIALLKGKYHLMLHNQTTKQRRDIVGLYEGYETTYGDYKMLIHFIKCEKHITNYMPLRILEWYHDGKTYVSNEALEDIEQKELRFGIIKHPIPVYIQLIEYAYLLGMKVNQESFPMLSNSFNVHNCMKKEMEAELVNLEEGKVKHAITTFLSTVGGDTRYLRFPVSGDETYKREVLRLLYQKEGFMTREEFEDLFYFRHFFKEEKVYSFNELLGLEALREKGEEIKKEFNKQSVKLLFHFPKEVGVWRSKIHDELFLYYLLPSILKKLRKKYSSEEVEKPIGAILRKYIQLDAILEKINNLPSEVNVTITNHDVFHQNIKVKDFLEGDIVKIAIQEIGYITLNKKTKEILRSGLKHPSYLTLMMPHVMDMLEQ